MRVEIVRHLVKGDGILLQFPVGVRRFRHQLHVHPLGVAGIKLLGLH